jgi:hypothetical protein
MELDRLLTLFLLYLLMPLWLAAGFADWLCHRRSDISTTSGAKESLLHLLMLVEVGIPILAGLFLEINALVLAIMIVGLAAHEATAFWDSAYSSTRRVIAPIEQHVHSFQEVIPPVAFSIVAMLHWDQFAALLTMSAEARYILEWKRAPLPASYLTVLLTAVALFEILPFAEEFRRGYTRNGGRLVPRRAAPGTGTPRRQDEPLQ